MAANMLHTKHSTVLQSDKQLEMHISVIVRRRKRRVGRRK